MPKVQNTDLLQFDIRPLEANDIPQLKALTDEEGWNDSQEYLEFLRNLSGGGFLAAFGKDGKLISQCGTQRISEDLGMITLYITHPDYRGRGVGRKVFDACMKHLGDINVVVSSLDGTQNMYASRGFDITSFWISTFQGIPKVAQVSEKGCTEKVNVVDVAQVDISSLVKYDETVHIIPRHEFLEKWLARKGLVCRVALEKGKVVGYGCMWPSVSGFMVMPLYAENKSALALWREFYVKLAPGKLIQVAAPSENTEAIQLFTKTIVHAVPVIYDVRLFNKLEVKARLCPVYSLYASCLI